MAGFYARQSLRLNLLPASKDKLAGANLKAAPTNYNDIFSYILDVSNLTTPGLILLPASAKLIAMYTNADLQKVTKLALKLFIQSHQ